MARTENDLGDEGPPPSDEERPGGADGVTDRPDPVTAAPDGTEGATIGAETTQKVASDPVPAVAEATDADGATSGEVATADDEAGGDTSTGEDPDVEAPAVDGAAGVPDHDTDRDRVDFSAVTTWLRRKGLLAPPPPPRPVRPRILVPAGQQVGGAGTETLAARPSTAMERFLGGRGTEPGVAGFGWQAWDWTPDADVQPIRKDRLARLIVVAATVAYIWLFAYWTMRNHDGYGTQAFDFGIYDQGLWLMSRFKRPFITIMGRHLFGDHTSFILLPLVPIYWIIPSAKVLLFAQAAALGAAAVPAFLLGREKLRSERLAALLAVVYLLHPAVAFINLEQFHPDVFEPVLILFALWFMVRKRWVGFLVCLGLALLVKEDVALLALPLGIYVGLRYDRRVGLIASLMSLTMISAALWWILPMYNGVGSLNSWRVPFGGIGGLVKTALIHPGEVITYATEKPRTWYMWQMFSPVAFLPFFDLRMLLVMVPAFCANLLSTFYYQYDIHYHYGTLIVPMLIAGTIFAVSKARSMAGRQVVVGIVLASSLVTAYLWGPTPLGRHEAAIASPDGNSIPFLEKANDIIPKDAVLSAFYGYVPHFDHRVEIYMFPNPFKASYWGTFKTEGQRLPQADRVEYILVPTILDPEPKAVLDQVRNDYDTIMEEGNVTVLRKKGLSG